MSSRDYPNPQNRQRQYTSPWGVVTAVSVQDICSPPDVVCLAIKKFYDTRLPSSHRGFRPVTFRILVAPPIPPCVLYIIRQMLGTGGAFLLLKYKSAISPYATPNPSTRRFIALSPIRYSLQIDTEELIRLRMGRRREEIRPFSRTMPFFCDVIR